MDIKSLIKEKLNESDVSKAAKMWGMTHIGFNHWKDRNGLVWNWDKNLKKFERNFDKEKELNHSKYNRQPQRFLTRRLIGLIDDYVDVNVAFKNIESKINQMIDNYNGEDSLVKGSKELKQFVSKHYQGKIEFDKFWSQHMVPVLKDIRDDVLKDSKKDKEKKLNGH